MVDLDTALQSGNLSVMLWAAAVLAFLHTVLGPDHYIPFVMMAKAQRWSRLKTMVVTLLCGIGHVGSSIIIGTALAGTGMVFSEWTGSRWANIHEARGGLSAWFLIGMGVVFFVWGTICALRGRTHTHLHTHEDGTIHAHEHDHTEDHMHVHESKANSITPWVLFAIFIFGPCESLIPLMLASWAESGLGGMVLVAGTFSIITILTIVGAVSVMMMGVSRISFGRMERWSHSLAGLSLVLCGVAIRCLGL